MLSVMPSLYRTNEISLTEGILFRLHCFEPSRVSSSWTSNALLNVCSSEHFSFAIRPSRTKYLTWAHMFDTDGVGAFVVGLAHADIDLTVPDIVLSGKGKFLSLIHISEPTRPY